MTEKVTAESVWKEYEKGEDHYARTGLHERVRRNEEMVNGDQWKGLNAPNLEKPVINIFHPAVTYLISQIVSDDVGIQLTPYIETEERDEVCRILSTQLDRVAENTQETGKIRELVRDAAIDGDGALYYYFDPDAGTEGEIRSEILDNDRVIFANPFLSDTQKQKYLLLARRMPLDEVRELAKSYGLSEEETGALVPDEGMDFSDDESDEKFVTVLLRFWKENGRVCFSESTRELLLRGPVKTGLRYYPLVWFPWEKVKNSVHGAASLTHYIPNQIYINKMWAMALTFSEKMAFPTRIYDAGKLPKGLSNKIGQAIGVPGSPRESVFVDTPSGNMSEQVLTLVQRTVDYTKMSMGITETALGNIKPENTSAIIAVQEATAAPLELQRRGLHQAMEDAVLIKLDLIREFYGLRKILGEAVLTGGEVFRYETDYDFRNIDYDMFNIKVNVGATSYWSELLTVETLDSLFTKGIIGDAVTYLESLPEGFVPHRAELIQKLRERVIPPENGEVENA